MRYDNVIKLSFLKRSYLRGKRSDSLSRLSGKQSFKQAGI